MAKGTREALKAMPDIRELNQKYGEEEDNLLNLLAGITLVMMIGALLSLGLKFMN